MLIKSNKALNQLHFDIDDTFKTEIFLKEKLFFTGLVKLHSSNKVEKNLAHTRF